MARHDTAPSASGAYGRLGPLTTRMLATGAATSSDKSLVADPDRHLQHQIPIGAQRLDRELAQVAAERRLRRIDEREKDFACRCSSNADPRRFALADTSRGSRRVVK